MRNFLLLLSLLLSLPACDRLRPKSPGEPVVNVGGRVITREMVELRTRAMREEPTVTDPEATALSQLVFGTLAAHVAADYGMTMSLEDVAGYWKSRQMGYPEIYHKLKAEGVPEPLFYAALIMPGFAVSTVTAIYQNDDRPHREAVGLTNRILAAALPNPKSFAKIARENYLDIDSLWVGPNYIRSPLQAQSGAGDHFFSSEQAEAAGDLFRQLSVTREGEVHPRAFNSPDGFQIAYIEKRERDRLKVALITVPKAGRDTWFWEEASKLPVHFTDVETGRKFLEQIDWGKRMLVQRELYPEIFTAAAR